MALFEDFEGRIPQVNKALKEYGFKEGEAGLNEARDLCKARGFDPYEICQSTQQICFEDAKWAYVLGSAIAIKEAEKTGVLPLLLTSVRDSRHSVCQVL